MEQVERRPDVDIEEDVNELVGSFAPLKASRPYFDIRIEDGIVKLEGNVRSPQARLVLLNNIPRIPGVLGMDPSQLYDDDTIRFAVGQVLPPGLFASVQFGVVALTGKLPAGVSSDAIINAIQSIPGVRRVGAEFEV
jgi:osmotically-inducible protein OsmY